MLSRGNRKLGRRLIWTFSLPSVATCPGRSALCERLCYADAYERRWPSVRRRYGANYRASRSPRFAARMAAFIRRRRVRVVRVHVGGDFYGPAYARAWLKVMRASPRTGFFFYSRAWRTPAVLPALAEMAALPNVRAWFSCDRDTGVPTALPPGVRVAWLMADEGDLPPRADLVFQPRSQRQRARAHVPLAAGPGAVPVCPAESGPEAVRTTCDRCGVCWRPPAPPVPQARRVPLPVIAPPGR